MKRIVYVITLIIATSLFTGCAIFMEAVDHISREYTNTVEKNGEDPIGAYNYAKAWQTGNAGKGLTIARLGVGVISEVTGINAGGLKQVMDDTANGIIADPNAKGSNKANWVGLAAHGGSSAAKFVAHKIDSKNFEKRLDAFWKENAKYVDSNSPYYDPYFMMRYEIDESTYTISKRDQNEFNAILKQSRREAESNREYELMSEFELVFSREEYDQLLKDEAKLYEYRCKLQEKKWRSGYSEAIYQRYMENKVVENTPPVTQLNQESGELPTANVATTAPTSSVSVVSDNTPAVIDSSVVGGYPFNGLYLSASQQSLLRDFAEKLKGDKGLTILITGHTCNIGTDRANMSMGLKRAQEAREYLIKIGVSPSIIKIESAGASKPLCDNVTPENRARNRRLTLEILK